MNERIKQYVKGPAQNMGLEKLLRLSREKVRRIRDYGFGNLSAAKDQYRAIKERAERAGISPEK